MQLRAPETLQVITVHDGGTTHAMGMSLNLQLQAGTVPACSTYLKPEGALWMLTSLIRHMHAILPPKHACNTDSL